MKSLKSADFADRQKDAAEAKRKLLENMKNRHVPTEAELAEKAAEAELRAARKADRAEEKRIEKEKQAVIDAERAEEERKKHNAEAVARKRREIVAAMKRAEEENAATRRRA